MIKKYFLISLLYSILFCNDNLDIDIGNFYEPALEGPVITFDPSYNTAFYLNKYNPNIFSDYTIMDIKINGSRFNSIGSYDISPIYKKFISDTCSSTAFEHNRGDYAHNENIIFINNKYENDISAFFMAQSNKYDGLPSINSNSEILQNYFFNVEKKYLKSSKMYGKISNSIMYHKENMLVPLSNGSYNRKSEDFLAGFSIESNYFNFIDFNFSNSVQINRGNSDLGLYSDDYNKWMDIDLKIKINKKLNLLAKYANKSISSDIKENESDYLFNDIFLNTFSFSASYKHKNIIFNTSLITHNQNSNDISSTDDFRRPRFNFNLIYDHKRSINFSLNKNTHSYINKNSNIMIDLITFNVDYKINSLKFSFEPFYLSSYKYEPISLVDNFYNNGNINGLNTTLSYSNNYLIADMKSSFYKSSYELPLNLYVNYSLLFSPKFNQNRYRPFIGINGILMDVNESTYIEISNDSNYQPYLFQDNEENYLGESKNVNLLNLELGIILNQFKISYHFTNPFNDNTLFSYSNNYQKIGSFSKLQVTWQFLD